MAWLNTLKDGLFGKLPLAMTFATAALVSGCNVGKSDTVTGTTTSGNTTSSTAKSGCTGAYIGGYEAPSHEERIRLRNLSLSGRGIPVTGNDDIDNANAGGGPPDGGIWMAGSLSFETDANCSITRGSTMIFYAYEYNVSGTVNKDGSFNLIWSGQGSQGDIVGQIDANNVVTGKFFHPAPDNFVYGTLNGNFIPNGKL